MQYATLAEVVLFSVGSSLFLAMLVTAIFAVSILRLIRIEREERGRAVVRSALAVPPAAPPQPQPHPPVPTPAPALQTRPAYSVSPRFASLQRLLAYLRDGRAARAG